MQPGALSPTATRDLLQRLNLRPKARLGQNFLIEGNLVRKALHLADVAPGDAVVEVGPGLGTLTGALLAAGAVVHAVERDPVLAAHLRDTLARSFPTRFHLIEGDAVEHPLAGLRPQPNEAFKIVANLPYAIATPWLEGVLDGPLPTNFCLMLQEEAARRYLAETGGSTGAISVFLRAAYEPAASHRVSAACFFPRPEIHSRLLALRRRPRPLVFDTASREAIRLLFRHRRKQLGSLFRKGFPPGQAEVLAARLHSTGFPPEARPEDLTTAAWQILFPPQPPPSA
ncbi:MAG: ribosomal RNA small subunit methyltransferase A [Puniceicoccaceae bacterium]|nr:MAG: ribosomal RNA small subunit methyltransferase A [Puniceicoccaceae bacterium]